MGNYYSFVFGQKVNKAPITGPTNMLSKAGESKEDAQGLHIQKQEVKLFPNVYVLNVEDTKDEDPQIEEELPNRCANEDCQNEHDQPEIVRAHVRIKGVDCPEDEAWICNLCHSCNSDDNHKAMSLVVGTKLYPVKMAQPHKTVVEESVEEDD